MPIQAKVHFFKMIQDSQEFGSDVNHMVSRVFFHLQVDEEVHTNLWSNVRQAYGGNFEDDPIEVDRPHGYKGPFNFGAFQEAAESYYRQFIGHSGSGIKIGKGSSVRMRNNTYEMEYEVKFLIDDNSPAW